MQPTLSGDYASASTIRINCHHRAEVRRHRALADTIVAKAMQLAVCRDGTSVEDSCCNCRHCAEVWRHHTLAVSIISNAAELTLFGNNACAVARQ